MNTRRLLTATGTVLACAGLVIAGAHRSIASPVPVSFNLVNDGSFEDQPVTSGSGFDTYNQGQTFGGWTVTGGNVDLISTYWTAEDGNQSVDMNGLEPGTISQTVNGLNVGQQYQLSFWMAGNTAGGPNVKTLTAGIGSNSFDAVFDDTGKSPSNMGWTQYSYDFTAANASELLSFDSTTTGACEPASPDAACGPALDNVSIKAVPEATTLTIFAYMMLTGVVLLIRRRGTVKTAA